MARFLLIDDDEMTCEFLTLKLQEKGHEVKASRRITDGAEVLNGYSPDVLVCDWFLSEGDSASVEEFVKLVAHQYPQTQIVLLSGLPKSKLEQQVKNLPVTKMIEKSLVMDDVVKELLEVLDPSF